MFVMLPVYLEKHGLTRWQIGVADLAYCEPAGGSRVFHDRGCREAQ